MSVLYSALYVCEWWKGCYRPHIAACFSPAAAAALTVVHKTFQCHIRHNHGHSVCAFTFAWVEKMVFIVCPKTSIYPQWKCAHLIMGMNFHSLWWLLQALRTLLLPGASPSIAAMTCRASVPHARRKMPAPTTALAIAVALEQYIHVQCTLYTELHINVFVSIFYRIVICVWKCISCTKCSDTHVEWKYAQ